MMWDEATPEQAGQATYGMTREPINIRAFGRALGTQTGVSANAVQRRMGIAGEAYGNHAELLPTFASVCFLSA